MLKVLMALAQLLASSSFVQSEDGQSLLDYVLLASLLALACVTAATVFGQHVSGLLTTPLP